MVHSPANRASGQESKGVGLLATLSARLMPAAFAIGGILAEFISVRMLICGSFLITPVCFVPMMFVPDIVRLINFNAEPQPPGGTAPD